uniref:Uncharacterized protein n=1 Tax=viral metagenome TaxID=1070528 RepID=A0A6M3K8J0_9ZZZZ
MSKCPICHEEYTTYGCYCLKVGSITSYKGLEQIAKITMREAAYSELLTPKINQIIGMLNLLIRLREAKCSDQ